MCTLTYLPNKHGGFFLTSNRDEKLNRPAAKAPDYYMHGNLQLLYPKDGQSGGTWLATSSNGITVCLLNGAFVKHTYAPPYAKSRGLVVLDFFRFKDIDQFLKSYSFTAIEPFTMLIFSVHAAVSEIRWDGLKLYFKSLDATKPYIWSSATLYSPEIALAREEAFANFLEEKSSIHAKDLIAFHHFDGKDSPTPAIKLLPINGTQTLSITCISHTGNLAIMNHSNLVENSEHTFELICNRW